jgi:hypothetical protein
MIQSEFEQSNPLSPKPSNAGAVLAVLMALLSCGVSVYAWSQAVKAQQIATQAQQSHELATKAIERIEALEGELRVAAGASAAAAVSAHLEWQAHWDPFLKANLKQVLDSLRIVRQEEVDGPFVVFFEATGPAGLYRDCLWFGVDSGGVWTFVNSLEHEGERNRSWHARVGSKRMNQLRTAIGEWQESSKGYMPLR